MWTIVQQVSCRTRRTVSVDETNLAAKLVSDAVDLESMGATGVARAFTGIASTIRPFYTTNPETRNHESPKSTIDFIIKRQLSLKDTMHTDIGKVIAATRHETMRKFIVDFLIENDLYQCYPELMTLEDLNTLCTHMTQSPKRHATEPVFGASA